VIKPSLVHGPVTVVMPFGSVIIADNVLLQWVHGPVTVVMCAPAWVLPEYA
jgi:hypothetical protein